MIQMFYIEAYMMRRLRGFYKVIYHQEEVYVSGITSDYGAGAGLKNVITRQLQSFSFYVFCTSDFCCLAYQGSCVQLALVPGQDSDSFAESWFMRKSKPHHKVCRRKSIIAQSKEKTLGRCFILIGILVGVMANNRNFRRTVSDDFEHQFHKSCTVCLRVCCAQSIVVFLRP